jgi:hypothetical protein
MSIFSLPLLLALIAAPPALCANTGAADGSLSGFESIDTQGAVPDREGGGEVETEAEESQTLLEALAAETRRAESSVQEALFYSLAEEFKLPGERKDARKALGIQERMLDLEDAWKARASSPGGQGGAVAGTPGSADPASTALERKRLAAARELMDLLKEELADMDEAQLQDYRNWMMVWEGRLRQRREAEEAAKAASPTAGAVPSAVASPASGATVPAGQAAATPSTTSGPALAPVETLAVPAAGPGSRP